MAKIYIFSLMHKFLHGSHWHITRSVERRSKGRILNFWIFSFNHFYKLHRTTCCVFHSILSSLITRLEITCAMSTSRSCHYLHHTSGSTSSRPFLPWERRETGRHRCYLHNNHAVTVHLCFWLDNELRHLNPKVSDLLLAVELCNETDYNHITWIYPQIFLKLQRLLMKW